MILLCALRWSARADIANPDIFLNKPSADFNLINSENILNLTITPYTSGDCFYSFALISGDSEIIKEAHDLYFNLNVSKYLKASFAYGVPEAGEVLHYIARASFSPGSPRKNRNDLDSDDNHANLSQSNGSSGSCSIYDDNIYHANYVYAEFSAYIEVRKIQDIVFVEIH